MEELSEADVAALEEDMFEHWARMEGVNSFGNSGAAGKATPGAVVSIDAASTTPTGTQYLAFLTPHRDFESVLS